MHRFSSIALSLLFLLGAGPANAADPILDALSAEIQRAMDQLSQQDTPPYYIAVELTEKQTLSIEAEDGALHDGAPTVTRIADIDVRVGSPELDSSHPLRKNQARPSRASVAVPLTDDGARIRRVLWPAIDKEYRAARSRWAQVQAEARVLVDEEPAQDLAPLQPRVDIGALSQLPQDQARWEDIVRQASAPLASSTVVLDGSVALFADVGNRWFADSDGNQLRHSEPRYRLAVRTQGLADDGDRIQLFSSVDASSVEGLPGLSGLQEEVQAQEQRLAALLSAPLEEPYTGPVILSDRAAGVFFHEIFGHRVEGHRLKQIQNAQTFRNQVGQSILPEFLSVVDDPTTASVLGIDLRGHYNYDNQGVPSEPFVLVDHGVLKGFLQSRSPIERGQVSNGHGRRQAGRPAVSRQGNLMVEAHESVSDTELRAELVKLAKAQGLDHGLYVTEIQGGFTFTDRFTPNAFNIDVVEAWRIFVDGRPDERVRGLNLIGTPLDAFSSIIRAGELHQIFNGSCGAESGWVPVSAVSPALLIEQLETQRKAKGQDTLPLLPPPMPQGDSAEVIQ